MGWLGDAWDAVTGAASDAWDWLTGDGAWGWLRALLIMIIIGAVIAGIILLIIGLSFWVEVAMVVIAVAFFFLVVYGIVTRKKTKPI